MCAAGDRHAGTEENFFCHFERSECEVEKSLTKPTADHPARLCRNRKILTADDADSADGTENHGERQLDRIKLAEFP